MEHGSPRTGAHLIGAEHGSPRTKARFSENQSTVLRESRFSDNRSTPKLENRSTSQLEHGSPRPGAHLSWRTREHLSGEPENISMFSIFSAFSMFSTCSELTPRAPSPAGRMEQFMQPCNIVHSIKAFPNSKTRLTLEINRWNNLTEGNMF